MESLQHLRHSPSHAWERGPSSPLRTKLRKLMSSKTHCSRTYRSVPELSPQVTLLNEACTSASAPNTWWVAKFLSMCAHFISAFAKPTLSVFHLATQPVMANLDCQFHVTSITMEENQQVCLWGSFFLDCVKEGRPFHVMFHSALNRIKNK